MLKPIATREQFDRYAEEKLRREFGRLFDEDQIAVELATAYPKPLILAVGEIRTRGVAADNAWDALPAIQADFVQPFDFAPFSEGPTPYYSAEAIDEFIAANGRRLDRLTPEAVWALDRNLSWPEWRALLFDGPFDETVEQRFQEVARYA